VVTAGDSPDPAEARYRQAVALIRARRHDDHDRLGKLLPTRADDPNRPLLDAVITVAAAIAGTASVNLDVPTDQLITYARDAVLELLHRGDQPT